MARMMSDIMTRRQEIRPFALAALVIFAMMMSASVSFAAGSYEAPKESESASKKEIKKFPMHEAMRAAKLALSEPDYKAALESLELVIIDQPDNPDAWNLKGYSHRKLGQNDLSMAAYEEALRLDKNHKGALEYQGELYLTLGQLEEAEDNLRRIRNQCSYICLERDMLIKAIERYKKSQN